jgi:hypothetical protein
MKEETGLFVCTFVSEFAFLMGEFAFQTLTIVFAGLFKFAERFWSIWSHHCQLLY